MKSISTINPAITENMEYSIVEACAPFISLKLGVSLDHAWCTTALNTLNKRHISQDEAKLNSVHSLSDCRVMLV